MLKYHQFRFYISAFSFIYQKNTPNFHYLGKGAEKHISFNNFSCNYVFFASDPSLLLSLACATFRSCFARMTSSQGFLFQKLLFFTFSLFSHSNLLKCINISRTICISSDQCTDDVIRGVSILKFFAFHHIFFFPFRIHCNISTFQAAFAYHAMLLFIL